MNEADFSVTPTAGSHAYRSTAASSAPSTSASPASAPSTAEVLAQNLTAALDHAQVALQTQAGSAAKWGRAAVQQTTERMRERPWWTVAAGVAVGVGLGALARSRRR